MLWPTELISYYKVLGSCARSESQGMLARCLIELPALQVVLFRASWCLCCLGSCLCLLLLEALAQRQVGRKAAPDLEESLLTTHVWIISDLCLGSGGPRRVSKQSTSEEFGGWFKGYPFPPAFPFQPSCELPTLEPQRWALPQGSWKVCSGACLWWITEVWHGLIRSCTLWLDTSFL